MLAGCNRKKNPRTRHGTSPPTCDNRKGGTRTTSFHAAGADVGGYMNLMFHVNP